jgi:glycosyltransferase involved in cell wall biosynthesis
MGALILVPAYEEEATIGRVVSGLRAAAPADEVLVVDDGSRDHTGRLALQAGATVLRHLVNLGYARALQTGMKYALARGASSCITFDADGQHDASDVQRLKERARAEDSPDLVIGSRFVKDSSYRPPLPRRAGMALFSWVTTLAGKGRIRDTTSGLRWMSAEVIQEIADLTAGDFHSEVLVYLLRRGRRVVEIPATVHERRHGQSMYRALVGAVYPLKTLVAMALLAWEARRQGQVRRG